MSIRPHGPRARGDLNRRLHRLLDNWQELCDELAQAVRRQEPISFLEVNVSEALDALVGRLSSAGPVVLHFPDVIATRDGGKLSAGYYLCTIKSAKAGGKDDADNVGLIRLRISVPQGPGDEDVRLQLAANELAAIYDAA